MPSITFAILTVSDTCYAKTAVDTSGPALSKAVQTDFPDARVLDMSVVPDDVHHIKEYLCLWASKNCDVILTTGGTGFSARDVTPEATRSVIDKEAPGLAVSMLSRSLLVTDMAMLSRPVCGIKRSTLIANLPGSTKGALECYGFIKTSIPHAVAQLKNRRNEIARVHLTHDKRELQQSSESKVKMNEVAFRNRKSPYLMVEMDAAMNIIMVECAIAGLKEVVNIAESSHRVLSEDVRSEGPIPQFDTSIKDGYAVKSSDGTILRTIRDVVAAGDNPDPTPLKPEEAVRISTGASIPDGADAVVQVEDTSLVLASPDGSKEITIAVNVPPKPGQDIRPKGSNISPNSLVLESGIALSPAHIGVLATIGKAVVSVFAQPKIAVISTGNELQDYTEKVLKPGHIRDSNKVTLITLLASYGYNAKDCGIAKDNPCSVMQHFRNAMENHDVIITTGGVSMGEYDVVKRVLVEDFGARIHFGRVNMKPGKPTTFATCTYNGAKKIIFGLPGNPVSATVACILFVIPALGKMECRNDEGALLKIPVELGEDVRLDERPEYTRAKLQKISVNGPLKAYLVGDQVSSRINSFVGADALLILPTAKLYRDGICRQGESLEAILLNRN